MKNIEIGKSSTIKRHLSEHDRNEIFAEQIDRIEDPSVKDAVIFSKLSGAADEEAAQFMGTNVDDIRMTVGAFVINTTKLIEDRYA